MQIATLCGSTSFKEDFLRAEKTLVDMGYIVLMPEVFSHSDNISLKKETEDKLLQLHKAKIDISDVVCIIHTNHYIGETTEKEIEYAKSIGVPILRFY